MNSPQPASGLTTSNTGPHGRRWVRRLVNVLVALAVIAVAAATFVFSYDGVRAIALLGGVSGQLARYYPGLFDAVLVIACVATVMLREGHWWARLWAWLVIVIVLGAIGATDVLHAMNYTLQHRPTEGVVAAAPVAAVLLAFSLLLALLRQSKTPAQAAHPTLPLDRPALPPAPAPTVPVPVSAVGSPAGSQDAPDEPAPPTVEVPAVVLSRPPAKPQSIRYADDARDAPPSADYWDAQETAEFAGLVYPARTDADDDTEGAHEPARKNSPQLQADAPPFAPAPRLRRVRSTPTPPADEDE